jgi:hypothetical protein
MADLVPLKVRIGLKADGMHKYPNFNSLPAVQSSGMEWSRYVDVVGTGWHYDKVSGHQEDTPDSPRGQQFGMLLVPQEFVDQAVLEFPNDCTELTEAEAQAFYESKVTIQQADVERDTEELTALNAERALRVARGDAAGVTALDVEIDKALNPNDPKRGVRKNETKRWADLKQTRGVTIPVRPGR